MLAGQSVCPLCYESHEESSCMWVTHPHPSTALVLGKLSVYVCGLIHTWDYICSKGKG